MQRIPRAVPRALCLALCFLVTSIAAAVARAAEPPPPGVEQLLPRGRIAAITEPRFVAADNAKLPHDAWVLGVVVEGVAKAYSLGLLNQHEVVNDLSGTTPFAAVW